MDVLYILLIIIILVLMYTIIPNFYNRHISKNVIKKVDKTKKEIALTFDDGPDDYYTEKLLDLLKKYNVKCTFMMVAEKAYNNKNIVKRVLDEGHVVGLHSFKHQSAWLSGPFKTINDFYKANEYMKKINLNIIYYRPPWGTFNILTKYLANKYKYITVLWSIHTRDWSSNSVEVRVNNLLNNIKAGDVVLLHDSNGAMEAPLRTIKALDIVIPKLLKKGYKFVTINNNHLSR